MALDYDNLRQYRQSHPTWRLMAADNAPLICSFFRFVFHEKKHREISQSELILYLEDFLYQIREREGAGSYPKSAYQYLEDWADNSRGWLRKFYISGSDEPYFDLSPQGEKALRWLDDLEEQRFIGTESRLLHIFDLLRQITHGVERDKEARLEQLNKQKEQLEQEIRAVEQGDIKIMDDRSVRERFMQFSGTARDLLSDFRGVEQNFRNLDRSIREEVAAWSGDKKGLLDRIFQQQDKINQSDQGKSFQAFWEFLMSPSSQQELMKLLEKVGALEALDELPKDNHLAMMHHDWIRAGDQAQRTVAQLSRQLRRFLEDQAGLESRRITELLDRIDISALALKEKHPKGVFYHVEGSKPQIKLPMERRLFSPPLVMDITSEVTDETAPVDTELLFRQSRIDKALLQENISELLSRQSQISLAQVIHQFPLKEGLAELMAYFSLASDNPLAHFARDQQELVLWESHEEKKRAARIPKILFNRNQDGTEP